MADKKYDVGILGVWVGCNYGSIMTYYALNQMITSFGYSVIMIDKVLPKNSGSDFEHQMTHSRRFGMEHYNIAPALELKDYKKLNDLCETFVVGSDQVWNYGISKSAGKAFYLDFADDNKKKIAYSVSFGHGIDFAPENERIAISKLMKRFDAIGIREDDGVRIRRDVYGVDALQVLDPVFLPDPEKVYKPLAEKSSHRETEPFIAAYILDPTPEKREALLHLSKKLGGLKIINLLDGIPSTFEDNRKKMALPNCIENLQVEDWLYYLSNAQFVVTDSCHGASFAMIFKKNFIPITNKRRGFSRFHSLASLFGFTDRLVTDVNRILTDESLLRPIDYQKIDRIMARERERSTEWLKYNLSSDDASAAKASCIKSVEWTQKTDLCTGCSACVNVCPKQAITLQQDNLGYYRRNVNSQLCVNCGLCTSICPSVKLPEKKNNSKPELYEFIAASEDVLYKSSSGGVFTVMANEAFRRGGAVSGAAWTDDFTVQNIVIDNADDLPKLRKSKYMQSYTGKVFTDVKKRLESGQFVLFTGTPCQVAGLQAFLRKDYDNLIKVDILCGNAPSSLFFKKYIQDSFGDDLKEYQFRYKSQSRPWNSNVIRTTDKKGAQKVFQGEKEDNYQRVYHSHTMCSKHCENCDYQSVPRYGDLSIGDFWGIGKREPSLDVSKGVSAVLCNNKKGKAFFESLPSAEIGRVKKVPLAWLGKNGIALNNVRNFVSPQRDEFYDAVQVLPFGKAVNYALKPNHGNYPYADSKFLLQCTNGRIHFSADRNIWEEHFILDHTVLVIKPEAVEPGNYATIPLNNILEKGKEYTLKVRFMIRTNNPVFNFHVKDSGAKKNNQVIYSYHIDPSLNGTWIERSIKFIPNAIYYDEFMIGASQLIGEDAFIAFDHIIITGK